MRLPSLPLLNRVCWLSALCLLLVPAALAQSTTSTQESFLAYRCEFDAPTNQAKIYASLVDVNGLPVPSSSYELALSTPTMSEVPPQRVTVTPQTQRPPLEMVIVLDTTDTMPNRELVPYLSTQLMTKLDVNDRVAFIAVDSQISPITIFYIDKNRLINENMLSLTAHAGDNQIYNGVSQAVDDLGAVENTRQVILFITDSAAREGVEQISAGELGTRARSNKTQIYPIGIHLYDDPSDEELISMATTSQGYAWIINEETRSNDSASLAVGDRLSSLIDTLNSEIVISVDMREQVPDAQNLVNFDLTARFDNGVTLTDQIGCPMEFLNHSIAFKDMPASITTSAPVDVSVTRISDLPEEDTTIVFRVNDEPRQLSDSNVFTFNTPSFDPGEYVITAQLRDTNDNILATTETSVTINSLQNIDLIMEGSLADLTLPMTFIVRSSPGSDLTEVLFRINRQSAPSLFYPLGAGRATFVNGVAELEIPNMKAEVQRLFPDAAEAETFDIRAVVLGLNDIVLAETKPPVSFRYSSAIPPSQGGSVVVATAPLNPVESFFASIPREVLLSWAVSFALVLLNLILLFRVGRARVRRMIYAPDQSEMSSRLMAITVRRDNLKQTISLTKRTVNLGRGSGNDINLGDDTNISREHAVVMWRRGHWYYTHRKPRLRTRIDGRRITGYVLIELEPVTEMDVGETKIFFHSASQQDVSELTKTNL